MDTHQLEILSRLEEAQSSGEAPRGLLFHGTIVEIRGPLKPGHYDDVFWTSDSPMIAQQYMAEAGSTTFLARPLDYELEQRVRPSVDASDLWNTIAKRISGAECRDIKTDAQGRACSWISPPLWPTYGDCVRFLEEELGYSTNSRQTYEIKQELTGNGFEMRPAEWKKPGSLYVTLADGLRFRDLRQSDEGDLGALEYHNVDAFSQARERGYDGVIINDFAQTKEYGNLGHVSFGLFEKAVRKLQWVRIPASNYPYSFKHLTSDVEKWIKNMTALNSPEWSRYGSAGDYTVWSRDHEGRLIYQVSYGDEPQGSGGYPNLTSLLRLKGLDEGDFTPSSVSLPTP